MIPEQLQATVDDFITAFGESETRELSNIENASENQVIRPKIQSALDIAQSMLLAKEAPCSAVGKVALRRSFKYYQLVFARYYLDSRRRREDVAGDFHEASKSIDEACKSTLPLKGITTQELEELGLSGINTPKILWHAGRRAFSDKSLEDFRKSRLHW